MIQHGIICDGECGYEKYPYLIQNPITRQSQEISDHNDFQSLLFQIINNTPPSYSIGQQLYWNICMHRCACPSNLYDNWSLEVLKRYLYCRDHPSVPPFEGSYNRQPAWWLDAMNIIDREVKALRSCNCFKCKPPDRKTI